MIQSEFYTTDQTTTSGFQLTGLINTIKADYTEDFGDPYMMGYIPYENIPSCWKPFKIEYDAEQNKIIAKSAMEPQNIGWGYVANLDNNIQTAYSDMYEYIDSWARISTVADSKLRFINAGQICKLNTTGTITFFNIVIKHDLSTDEYILNTTARQHVNIYVKDFIDFLNRETTMNFLINGNNVDIECVTDDDGLIVYNDGTNDYYIIITYFACSQDTGNVQSYYRNLFNPFVKFKVQNEGVESTILEIPYTYGISGSGYSYLVNTTNSTVSEQSCTKFSDYYFGNISEGEYDLTEAQTLQTDYYKRFGNTFITKGSNNRYFVVCNYNKDDLLSMLTIVNKYKNNAQADSFLNGYDTTVSVAIFNNDNIPQRTRLSDTYQNLIRKLQPWQLKEVDITANEFDPKSIPPYQPTPGPSDDSKDKGDIGYNTNVPAGISAFTTSYILSAGALTQLGRDLWSKVNDPNAQSHMIENFFHIKPPTVVSATPSVLPEGTVVPGYELTTANIINYFISLKYFPFNLATYTANHVSSPPNTIKVGSGTEAISTGGYNSLITGTNLVVLDGGSVVVPTQYNSFLDHEPYASVSVYVPYCGSVNLQPSLVRGATLSLRYCVDLNTGGCMAILMKSGNGASFPVATINGTMGFDILLTGNNAQTVQANANNVYANAVTQSTMNTAASIYQAGIHATSGNLAGVASDAVGAAMSGIGTALNYANDLPQLLGTSPLTAGSSSMMAALMSPQTAYVQIRYRIPKTDGYEWLGGIIDEVMPISMTNGMGYVKIVNPRLGGLSCTRAEKEEIRALLAAGIFT